MLLEMANLPGRDTYDLVENVLKKNYHLFMMDLAKEPVVPDTFKLLIIVKPTLDFYCCMRN